MTDRAQLDGGSNALPLFVIGLVVIAIVVKEMLSRVPADATLQPTASALPGSGWLYGLLIIGALVAMGAKVILHPPERPGDK